MRLLSGASSPMHEPLGDDVGPIRFLTILPNEDHQSKIERELGHAFLFDEPTPAYEALSYVWGGHPKKLSTRKV